jgi:hypothetical protein
LFSPLFTRRSKAVRSFLFRETTYFFFILFL